MRHMHIEANKEVSGGRSTSAGLTGYANKCHHCGGYLDTGFRCCQCGKWCPPKTETSAGTCTAGNGWCPLHGDQCPVTITTFPQHNAKAQFRSEAR